MSRWEMREAKKSAGICLHPICGGKALQPWQHCAKHLPPNHHVARRVAELEAELKRRG